MLARSVRQVAARTWLETFFPLDEHRKIRYNLYMLYENCLWS